MRTNRILLFLLVFFGMCHFCYAVPFDLIVPSDVKIRTQPGISGVGSPWGWLVATDTQLSFDQLHDRIFSLSTDNPNITVSTTFSAGIAWTPMQPGDVAGLDVSPFTDQLRQLLLLQESVNPLSSNFWRWEITFPPEFVGQVTLQTELEIDQMYAVFDTHFYFDPSFGTETEPIEIVSAQRITAIPEPITVSLLMLGGFTLLCQRRATRHQHQSL